LLIVWFLTGLWHGASWNFILWGLYFGVLIIIERLGWGKILEKLPAAVSTLYTFLLVVFGWVLFDIDGLSPVISYLKAMFGGAGKLIDEKSQYLLVTNLVLFAVCIFASTEIFQKILANFQPKKPKLISIAAPAVQLILMLFCTAYLVNATYNPFLYFRF
jgi:alginate O-acetyltransferase complex protein AlgI